MPFQSLEFLGLYPIILAWECEMGDVNPSCKGLFEIRQVLSASNSHFVNTAMFTNAVKETNTLFTTFSTLNLYFPDFFKV